VCAQGAGYRSTPRGRFDPLNQAASGAANALDAKLQASPEELCLEAEAKVHAALEQSAEALAKGDASAGKHSCCAETRAIGQHFETCNRSQREAYISCRQGLPQVFIIR